MMICPICNKELPNDSIFCHFCGANIAEEIKRIEKTKQQEFESKSTDTQAQKKEIYQMEHTSYDNKSKSNGSLIAIGALAMLSLVLLVIVFCQVLGKNDSVRSMNYEEREAIEFYEIIKDYDLKQQFEDFYAEYLLVLVEKNGEFDIPITIAHDDAELIFETSNSSIADIEWAEEWNGQTTNLIVHGNKDGVATITLTNSVNDETITILLIVT